MNFVRFLIVNTMIFLLVSTLCLPSLNADNEKQSTDAPLLTSGKVDTQQIDNSKTKNIAAAEEDFNIGVDLYNSKKPQEAIKYYTEAVKKGKNNPSLRSKAFQNIGVIQHESARALLQQNPEECLKILDKAEQSYLESMKLTPGKEISINQQILLNDRKKAKEIIKNRKQMEQKKNEAKEKTKDALNKQQQANKDKESDQKKKEQKQQDANKQTQQANKAMQDYKDSAQKANSKQDQQNAQEAQKDLQEAQKDQQNNQGKEAEQKLQEALKKLGGENTQNQDQQNQKGNNSQQNKQQQQKQQQKQQSSQNNNKGEKQKQEPNNIPKQQNMNQNAQDTQKPQYDNKDLTKKQAESVIRTMTEGETSLNDALKKKEKEEYSSQVIEKDW